MPFTEEQAKQKWCPHARDTMDIHHGAANRDYQGKPMSMCIGSACMAWRWYDCREEFDHTTGAKAGDVPARPTGDGWEANGEPNVSTYGLKTTSQGWVRKEGGWRRGFCGLSGEIAAGAT